ncbi:SLATT domain-containing protein [Bradyrhizobium oligotrophicum]|uniref:SLATT domain-containing protein n=1 Tax=Bradyrhizobium oligotrophicum TaxID=44255 RepID=UPI003EC000B9
MADVQSEWSQREQDLLRRIEEDILRYLAYSQKSRLLGRALSVISLFCSVVAPVTVISSASNLTSIGMSNSGMAAASVILTVLLGLIEGLRRIFGYEQRWVSSMTSAIALKSERDRYLDDRIGKEIGSEEWKQAFLHLREGVDAIVARETSEFFRNVLSAPKSRDGDKTQ